MWKWVWRALQALFLFAFLGMLIGRSDSLPADKIDQVRGFTRLHEFDFVSWTVDALLTKGAWMSLGGSEYLDLAQQRQVVLDYLKQVDLVNQIAGQINALYSDPSIKDPQTQSQALTQRLGAAKARLNQLSPLAEAVLQSQVTVVAAEDGLTLGGQPVPPILYRTTDPPDALIISPRNVIREDADISLNPGLTSAQKDTLETKIQSNLNLSALVVGIGGIGLYPTMVMETSDLNWLAETVSHEWIHNFLTLRPLGLSYDASPDMRTINETTASLAGREIGAALVRQYYPDQVPPPTQATPPAASNGGSGTAGAVKPAFNFNAEMHLTRVTVDQMLAAGQITQAESYMEQRRLFFWAHGYQIRKINQAYFAFYGAYNDVSAGGNANGTAGNDPIGPAVVALRARYPTLGGFLNRISWITSPAQLLAAAKSP